MRAQFGVSTGLLLSGGVLALVFAYLVRFLAVALSAVESGLARMKPSLRARGAGARRAPGQGGLAGRAAAGPRQPVHRLPAGLRRHDEGVAGDADRAALRFRHAGGQGPWAGGGRAAGGSQHRGPADRRNRPICLCLRSPGPCDGDDASEITLPGICNAVHSLWDGRPLPRNGLVHAALLTFPDSPGADDAEGGPGLLLDSPPPTRPLQLEWPLPDAQPRRALRHGGPGAAWCLPALAARIALAACRLGCRDRPRLLVDPGGADRDRPAPAGSCLPLGARALRAVHPGLRRHPFPVDLDPLAPGLWAAGRGEGGHRRGFPAHRRRPLAAAAAAARAALRHRAGRCQCHADRRKSPSGARPSTAPAAAKPGWPASSSTRPMRSSWSVPKSCGRRCGRLRLRDGEPGLLPDLRRSPASGSRAPGRIGCWRPTAPPSSTREFTACLRTGQPRSWESATAGPDGSATGTPCWSRCRPSDGRCGCSAACGT